MRSREMAPLLSTMLGIGFDFVDALPILPGAIADKKERYRKMVEREIPMFYIMQLKKNENNFVSSTEGVVKQIQPYKENGLSVVFVDEEKIIIPRFRNWENVKPNDQLTRMK